MRNEPCKTCEDPFHCIEQDACMRVRQRSVIRVVFAVVLAFAFLVLWRYT